MSREIHVLARAVLIDNGHLLLCKTTGLLSNFYFLPGGHIEEGEQAEKALVRELQEETGKTVAIKRFLGCMEYLFLPKSPICHQHEYNLVFEVHCSELSSKVIPKQCEEHVELHFIPLKELNNIPFHPEKLLRQLPMWLAIDSQGGFITDNATLNAS